MDAAAVALGNSRISVTLPWVSCWKVVRDLNALFSYRRVSVMRLPSAESMFVSRIVVFASDMKVVVRGRPNRLSNVVVVWYLACVLNCGACGLTDIVI